ncbi:MAG: HNH endonuclease signature motif containing protein [Gammaproteobacteria bacterium]|nr:HNH endonuclease signature motif containing protein [Gammaproteobacteria bacterium]
MAKDWKRISEKLWPRLVKEVQKHETVTYKKAASWVGTNARSIGPNCLGYIQDFCMKNGYPGLTAVVVKKGGKGGGMPSGGFDWGTHANSSEEEKRAYLKEVQKKVYEFNWGSVNYSPIELRWGNFVDFVRLMDGAKLTTLAQNKEFVVEIFDNRISFTPVSTSKERTITFDDLKNYLDAYNSGCRQTSEFTEKDPRFRNASYFLSIVEEYEKSGNAIFRKDKISKKDETEKNAVVKARQGQGKFREELLKYWKNTCAVTGVNDEKMLRASHIKPWKDSDNKDRLNPYNGLLLTPNLDALFDQGLITFGDDGKIRISTQITERNLERLSVDRSMSLRKIGEEHKKFLAHHRKSVFSQ